MTAPCRALRGSRREAAHLLMLGLAVTTLACVGEEARSEGTSEGTPEGAASVVLSRPSSEAIPARFGVGRSATEAEIAVLDIDVMPDGTGLPPGRGTVPEGEEVYRTECVSCHGAELEGTPMGNPLVPQPDYPMFPDGDVPFSARAIGNYWPYATTIFDYVRRAMPYDRPGSLSDDEVYAVTAYLLWMNGIVAEDAVMDATTLPEVVMPARDRFVEDDRLESDRVR